MGNAISGTLICTTRLQMRESHTIYNGEKKLLLLFVCFRRKKWKNEVTYVPPLIICIKREEKRILFLKPTLTTCSHNFLFAFFLLTYSPLVSACDLEE